MRLLLPTHFDIDFSQDLMCSSPRNRIFAEAVAYNLRKRRREARHNQHGVLHAADAMDFAVVCYTQAIIKSLFNVSHPIGGRRDRLSGLSMPEMREAISRSAGGLIVSPRETTCHTAVYEGPDRKGSCKKWLDKQPVLRELRRKPWVAEINAAWGKGK